LSPESVVDTNVHQPSYSATSWGVPRTVDLINFDHQQIALAT